VLDVVADLRCTSVSQANSNDIKQGVAPPPCALGFVILHILRDQKCNDYSNEFFNIEPKPSESGRRY